MIIVSDIIKDAANLIPNSMYLRATDVQANMDIENFDIGDNILVVFNNLPSIAQSVKQSSIIRKYPIEIQLLKLAQADDNTVDGDMIRESLLPYADLMFDYCMQTDGISATEFATDYGVDYLDVVKIYDDILTGLTLKFNMFFDRNYYCIS